MTPGHNLIRASAGTGKTFQLTNRFLELLDAGADPGCMLATTFTRKAAGEIRDRVLERLARGARDDGIDELREHVRRDITADDCRAALVRLVRELHRINVRTLDAFFLRAAGTFQFDLDVPAGWRIAEEDEDAALREAALDDALISGDPNELPALLSLLFDDEARASVHQAVSQVVKDAYDIWRRVERPEAWRAIAPVRPSLDEARIAELVAQVRTLDLPRNKGDKQVPKLWQRARDQIVEALESGAIDLAEKGLLAKVLADAPTYDKHEIDDDVRATVHAVLDHLGSLLAEKLRRRNGALCTLLGRFDSAYTARKRRAAAYRFDDLPRLLDRAEATGHLDLLYYRLDAQCHHLLLDEFQDTSAEQFGLLEPIADEIIATRPPERTFFCVGDEKQSLYGWRNAEPGLLGRLHDLWPGLASDTLRESWRSSQIVLDAVNAVFGRLDEAPCLADYAETRRAWSAYPSHRSAKDLGGAVRISLATPKEGEKRRATRARGAAERVKAIRDAAPTATVGVLVRSGKEIPWILDELRRLEIPAAREGAGALMDSPPVAAAVAAMAFADHPDHGLVRFHVAMSAIGQLIGFTDPRDRDAARATARRLRRRCAEEGCAAVLADWLRQCAGGMDERGFHRFGQLVAVAEDCDELVRFRPSRLARAARERKVPEPDIAPVRVMTIHASKGLEFDAVVLPQLDHSWSPKDRIAYSRADDGSIAAVTYRAPKKLRGLDDRLERICSLSEQEQFTEELCCLYVAMTRARHVLELVMLPEPEKVQSLRPDCILRELLACPADPGDAWSREDGDWARDVARASAEREPVREAPRTPFAPPARGERTRLDRAPRRSPSALEGGQRVDLRQRLRPDGARARRRGAIMHAFFALVAWIDDGAPSDEALRTAAAREGARDEEVDDCIADFRSAVETPAVRAVLHRPGTGHDVYRERRFTVRDEDNGDPVLLTGAFDRVVVQPGERVHVIDFKTDTDVARRQDDLVAHYRPQMQAYGRAAARLWRVAPDRVELTLVFTETGAAVQLDSV